MDEAQIIRNAQENILHFEDLYNLYFQKVFRYFMARTSDEPLAEDLTSQTFLKALQNFKKYQYDGAPFGAWLFRIAHNNLVDHYRKHKTTPDLLHEDLPIRSNDDVAENTNNKLLAEKIHDHLRGFEKEAREILLLKLVSDLKFSDIAKVLDMKENTVKTKYFRTLKKIKTQMSILAVCLGLIRY